MPKKNEEKRRWTDPVILVPIIVAVITAIVSPIVVPIIQDQQKQQPLPTQEPTSSPVKPSVDPDANPEITVETDKLSYVAGETFKISGNVGKPEFGELVRIDVYRPDGGPLPGANGLVARPERDGSYSYDLGPMTYVEAELMPGKYTVQVTYLKQSNQANFIVE